MNGDIAPISSGSPSSGTPKNNIYDSSVVTVVIDMNYSPNIAFKPVREGLKDWAATINRSSSLNDA